MPFKIALDRLDFTSRSVFLRCAVLLLLCTATVATSMSYFFVRGSLALAEETVRSKARGQSALLAERIGEHVQFERAAPVAEAVAGTLSQSEGAALGSVVLDAAGNHIVESGLVVPGLSALAARALAEGPVASADGLQVALPVATAAGTVGAIAVAWTAEPYTAEIWRSELRSGLVALALLAVSLGVATWILRTTVTRPLLDVGQAMGEVAARRFDVEVPGTGRRDEIGRIASALERFRGEAQKGEALVRAGVFKGAGFDCSSAAMMMADADLNIVYVNAAFTDLAARLEEDFRLIDTEFDPANIIGSSIDRFHRMPEHARKIIGDPSNLPYNAAFGMGASVIALDIAGVTDHEGKLVGYVAEWQDVTVERRNAAVLSALEAIQATAEFGADGRLRDCNALFAQMAGRSADELKGAKAAELIGFEGGDMDAALASVEPTRGRFRPLCADGSRAVLDGSLNPVLDGKGQARCHVLLGTDNTASEAERSAARAARAAMEREQNEVVDALREALGRLSRGDLSRLIEEAFPADHEQLRHDFNEAIEKLRAAIVTVIENAAAIDIEARNIAGAADDLSQRTETQAATLEETVAALNQITESVRVTSEGARRADQVVTEARTSAEDSGTVVGEAVRAMGEIEKSSEQISKIIGVIDDIAFQTNLLALNAGVEAARAGDAGRGFAVVASEVRALAQRSSDAAREINGLISSSSNQVRRGVDLVGEAGRALEGIVASVADISRHVSAIASSAQEQSGGLDEINVAMKQLDQVTQQNAAMFEETTAASHALTREAETLSHATRLFDVGGAGNVVTATFRRTTPPAQPAIARAAAASGGKAVAETEGWEEF
ncbi:methyl-accepting chemotaxis protein [Roseitranquillus sediminis]|uniref:methyl-accepting chemotaxis protein n=1 Tax=Roseitranquillus sediminis TaxID=2809051 RepID=UPI001D0C8575|nr:methyl-accepting chemotaxis protein [Roseitranquillus sediminis]MBM9595192.1 PAS domain-containing protein [Roseitranquillus sediminis]